MSSLAQITRTRLRLVLRRSVATEGTKPRAAGSTPTAVSSPAHKHLPASGKELPHLLDSEDSWEAKVVAYTLEQSLPATHTQSGNLVGGATGRHLQLSRDRTVCRFLPSASVPSKWSGRSARTGFGFATSSQPAVSRLCLALCVAARSPCHNPRPPPTQYRTCLRQQPRWSLQDNWAVGIRLWNELSH